MNIPSLKCLTDDSEKDMADDEINIPFTRNGARLVVNIIKIVSFTQQYQY
jgi:hypothetical protein